MGTPGGGHICQQIRRSLTPQLLRRLNLSLLSLFAACRGVDRAALVQRHTKRILLEFSKPPANRPRDSVPVGCHGCWGESESPLLWADRHSRGTFQKPSSHHEGVLTSFSYSAPGGWPLAACRGTWCRCTGSTVSQLVLCCVTRSTSTPSEAHGSTAFHLV